MSTEKTQQRIPDAALDLLLDQGIKKTSLEEVAHRAGVTRITVYRYYPDKKQLVEAALMRVPMMLEAVQTSLAERSIEDVETVLEQIWEQLAAMPKGDFPALLEELQRIYPDVWRKVHDARTSSISGIFHHLFALVEKEGRLRPGLNHAVVQAYFTSAVVDVLEQASLVTLGLPAEEIFRNVKNIFLYGILKEQEDSR